MNIEKDQYLFDMADETKDKIMNVILECKQFEPIVVNIIYLSYLEVIDSITIKKLPFYCKIPFIGKFFIPKQKEMQCVTHTLYKPKK